MNSLIFAIQTIALVSCISLYLWSAQLSGKQSYIAKNAGIVLSGLIIIGMLCTIYHAIEQCYMNYQYNQHYQDMRRTHQGDNQDQFAPQMRNSMQRNTDRQHHQRMRQNSQDQRPTPTNSNNDSPSPVYNDNRGY